MPPKKLTMQLQEVWALATANQVDWKLYVCVSPHVEWFKEEFIMAQNSMRALIEKYCQQGDKNEVHL